MLTMEGRVPEPLTEPDAESTPATDPELEVEVEEEAVKEPTAAAEENAVQEVKAAAVNPTTAAAPRGGGKNVAIFIGVGVVIVAVASRALRRFLRKGSRGSSTSNEGIIISDVRLLPPPLPKGADPPALTGLKFVVSDV